MMKKLLSLVLIAVLLTGMTLIGVISAGAVDVAQTVVDVKNGDKVTYTLMLGGVPEKVVGCDFSVYYDKDAFTVDSVADFTDTTDDWSATINPNIPGEVRGNWSILAGVNFAETRNFVTLNLTAKADASAHLSYYIRFMYGNSVFDSDDRPQITEYTFTCSVTVNGEPVLEDAQPELNVEEDQDVGSFVNSVDGEGEDADVNVVEGDLGSAGSGSGNSGNSGDSGNSDTPVGDPTAAPADATASAADDTSAATLAPATDAQDQTAASTDAAVAATSSDKPVQKTSSVWLWVIIGLIVLIAGGGIVYFVMKNKKKGTSE